MDSACRKHQPPGSEDEGAFDRFRESERESSEQFGLLGQSKEREGSTLFNGDWIWAPSDALLDQEPYFNYFGITGRATHG